MIRGTGPSELVAEGAASVEHVASVAGAGDQAGGVQHLQVLGHGAGCDLQSAGELGGGGGVCE
jgi:hypothetical protein